MSIRSSLRGRLAACAAGVALLLAAALAGPAAVADTTTKPALVTVTPVSMAAGAIVPFEVVITNQASPQSLGSANLTPPDALTVSGVSSTAGDITLSGSTIRLRNLNLAPEPEEGAVTVTGFLTAPCSSTGGPWIVVIKQANNFSGPPGNDFVLAEGSSTSTAVSGSCHLEFLVQPHNAEKSKNVTGTDFVDSDTPVEVELRDGSNNVVTSFTGPVSLTLNTVAGSGSLVGGGPVNAVAGVATFTGLQVTAAGLYTVTATATGLSLSVMSDYNLSTPATNDPFTIVDDACAPGDTCTVNIPTQMQVQSTNTGAAGSFLTLSVVDRVLDCGDSFQHAPFVTEINSTDSATTGTKTDTVTIYKQYVNAQPNNGAAFFQVCYQAPYTFTTRDGTPATEDPTGTFTGLLPDCASQNPQPPCILMKNKTGKGDVVIVLLLPAGDPGHK
jgi:hypothetical protein